MDSSRSSSEAGAGIVDIGTNRAYAVRGPGRAGPDRLDERALMLWPRLDRRKLSRCAGDPRRMAALIERRTNLPQSAILSMLLGTSVDEDEIATWFG
jgi:hypothetical protein